MLAEVDISFEEVEHMQPMTGKTANPHIHRPFCVLQEGGLNSRSIAMLDQAKKRILSVEEAGWIERANEEIQTNNAAIMDLAGVLVIVAELAGAEGLDPYIEDRLCKHGVQALAFSIKALGSAIEDKHQHIDEVLSGIISAEMHARRKVVDSIHSSVQRQDHH